MLQGNQQALQLRQADLAAASSAGSVSPGATVGHRPLSRAHSSPVVGKHTKIIILAVFSSSLFFFGGGGRRGRGEKRIWFVPLLNMNVQFESQYLM